MWHTYIGLPYALYDCWELIAKIYWEMHQIDLGLKNDPENARLINWTPIEKEDATVYDVLLFSDGPGHKHVGMVLQPPRFLHSMAGVDSCIGNWTDPRWKLCLKNIYRHRAFTSTEN